MIQSQTKVDLPITKLNQINLIELPVKFTLVEAIAFKQKFEQLCQTEPPIERIILDFDQTRFMDSSGIGALATSLKTAKSEKIDLVFWSFSPEVQLVLSLTGLDKVFVMDSGTEALIPNNEEKTREDRSLSPHPSVNSKVKRAIDILAALVGLGIMVIILIPIAFAIKFDSPGSVFSSQICYGYMGRRFRLWQFRTEVAESESSGSQNLRERVLTKVGQFLEKTSLHKLPQFWNVLKGEMSLVGIPAPAIEEVEDYSISDWQRLNVKPGMTGEWLVNQEAKITNFAELMELDLHYQKNWTLGQDLKILLKTIMVVFNKSRGV
jgi:anti-anti-sigma factor